jgi:site-specific DNA recombinase
MRAALYARYSTGNQSPLSIEDQLRLCRQFAAAQGAPVVREFTDAEISGFVSDARPGLNDLLAFARQGGCDLVIAEHSDRLARDGEKGWQVFHLFRRLGVRYETVQQGKVTTVHQGVANLVSELKGEEATLRTHRGLQGVVEDGRSAGGLTYGYKVKRLYDERGEPIRGHLEIDEGQAQVVRRIFRDYVAGASPLAIATALNAEGVPGPRGGAWNHSTIGGNAARGVGLIHNELYVGVRIWGRRTFVKDRSTGTRNGRTAEAEPIRKPAPELRIISDELWASARARHAEVSTGPMGAGQAGRRRPKRFLQGLIVCGVCGGPMSRAGPKLALRCTARTYRRGCTNSSAPGYPGIEARVIASLKANLLHPEVIERAIRTVHEGLRQARLDAGKRHAKLAAELAETKRRMDRLIDQVEQGAPWSAVAERHGALDARRTELQAQLSADSPDAPAAGGAVIDMLPSAAGKYRRLLEELAEVLANPDRAEDLEGRAAVRALIEKVVFHPREGRGQYELEIVGDLAPILMLGAETKNGPREGAASSAQGSRTMRAMGAGTRITRSHNLSVPVRLAG